MSRLPTWSTPLDHHQPRPRKWFYFVVPTIVFGATFSYASWRTNAGHATSDSMPWAYGAHHGLHTLRSEQGLLYLNTSANARHPIPELIAQGHRSWEDKLARQSRTLREAVTEYERRYKRKPPLGFDKWEWCAEHDVQLPDEYDQLASDLEMFWALRPSEMRAAQKDWEEHASNTFTIGKTEKNGSVQSFASHADNGMEWAVSTRTQRQIDVLKPIAHLLPPFRATWTAHDSSMLVVSWEMREQARKAVAAGGYIDFSQSKEMPALWSSACPPDSPIRTSFNKDARYHPADEFLRAPKSFIADHRASMDPCYTPVLAHISVLLDRIHGLAPTKAFHPEFTRSKTLLHSDIMGIPTEDRMSEDEDTIAFRDKKDDRLVWRGRTTGVDLQVDRMWNMSHRLRFVEFANRKDGHAWVLPPPADLGDRMRPAQRWGLRELNRWFVDAAFVEVFQCAPKICDEVRRKYRLEKVMYPEQERQYKYVMDMDGNAWSSRFRRLVSRKVVVFKSTIHPEWWTDRIQPWVHFVPIKLDYSDLYDTLGFFRGLPDGTPGHEDLAERIANAGSQWARKFWRQEDIVAYTWRMYLEYIRLMSDDRDNMNFVL